MDILLLGSGTGGWPRGTGIPCDARGLNRRECTVLIDGEILFDPNPDVPDAIAEHGVDPEKIRYVLISHSHGDHYSADTLKYLADMHPIDVYGDDGYLWKLPQHPNLTFHPLERRKPVDFPFGRLTAVLSTHDVEDTDEFCLHYILERDGKTVFYGPDGAWFGGGTWYEMEKHRFDCVILDATFGDDASKFLKFQPQSRHIWFYHNSLSMLKTIRDAFFDKKMADDHTLFVAYHLSQYYYADIRDAHAAFDPIGYVTPYDGMVIRL